MKEHYHDEIVETGREALDDCRWQIRKLEAQALGMKITIRRLTDQLAYERMEEVECPHCDGEGKVEYPEGMGHGEVDFVKIECWACNGTGNLHKDNKQLTDSEFKEIYGDNG